MLINVSQFLGVGYCMKVNVEHAVRTMFSIIASFTNFSVHCCRRNLECTYNFEYIENAVMSSLLAQGVGRITIIAEHVPPPHICPPVITTQPLKSPFIQVLWYSCLILSSYNCRFYQGIDLQTCLSWNLRGACLYVGYTSSSLNCKKKHLTE